MCNLEVFSIPNILIFKVKGDGNCFFNAVLQEMEFNSLEDELFYTLDRLRRQVIAFFTGRKAEYVDWIRTYIRNIYLVGQTDTVKVSLVHFLSKLT